MEEVILVTGSSRGIGAATALLAAEKGFSVCVHYHKDREAALGIVKIIEEKGGKAISVAADMANEADIVGLYDEIDRSLGRLTALVNNAGTLEQQMKVVDMPADRISRILTTNVMGPILCSREAIKRMSLKNGGQGGAIVNVSSVAAKHGSPFEYNDYAASKGAIDTFTIGLAKEVAEEGIRVNGVRPGFIYTRIHALGGEPERVERVRLLVPMKRGGETIEVARAILWLISEEASYTSGAILDVAGGK